MKVLFAPDYNDNDYQKLLKIHLIKNGVELYSALNIFIFPIVGSVVKFKVDILHLHWLNSYLVGRNNFISFVKSLLVVFELILVKLLKVKIVWTVHNLYNHQKHCYKLEVFFNRIIIHIVDAIIVHTNAQKNKLISYYRFNKANIYVIGEGSYKEFYSIDLSQKQARDELNILSDKLVFLFFGQLRKYKNIDFLINAFIASGKDGILIIAGKPGEKEIVKELKDLIGDDKRIIIYPFYIPIRLASLLFKASDIVVLPYNEYLNSAVAYLTISMEKPAILKKDDNFIELFGDGGFYYEDFNSFVNIFRKITRDEIKKKMEVILKISKKLSWDETARKTIEVYRL